MFAMKMKTSAESEEEEHRMQQNHAPQRNNYSNQNTW